MDLAEAEQLSHVVGLVYDCIVQQELWPVAIEHLAGFVGGGSALLFHQDRAHQSGDFLYSFNADPEWTRRYFDHYIRINPVLPFTVLMDVGDCAALSTYISLEEYKRTRFYIEWAAPQNFMDVIVTILEKSASSMGIFAVTRFEAEGPAGDAQMRRMALVAPHVRRAVNIQRLFSTLEAQAATFVTAVDALPNAVYFLSDELRVVFANAAGRRLAERGEVLSIAGGRLSVRDPLGARRLAEALRRQSGPDGRADPPTDLTLEGPDGVRLAGHLVPLSDRHRREIGPSGAVAALFVRAVETRDPPPMQLFAQRFGFTPRELQVFNGIVQFGGVPEVARIYGLAPTTVRTHLQNIFDKTGVRSQSDLMRLVGGLAPPDA